MKDLDIEEIKNYYSKHTFKDTAAYFNISVKALDKFFKTNNLIKRTRNLSPQALANLKSPERANKISHTFQNKTPKEKIDRINKIKTTSIIRYGVDDYAKTKECKELTKQINLEKYGVEYYTQTPEWKEFKHNFYINRSPEDKEKSNIKRAETTMGRYGVNWFCNHPDSRNKK